MINVTLTLSDALNVLKSDNLPLILRIQLIESIQNEFNAATTHTGKVENRVAYLEAEIRGVIECLSAPHNKITSNDLNDLIIHLKAIL